MPAMTYGALIGGKAASGSLRNWLNYDPLPAPEIVSDAQAWIYSRLRCREMLAYADLTLNSGSFQRAVPDRFLDPVIMAGPDGEDIDLRTEEHWVRHRELSGDDATTLNTGRPTFYCIMGDTLTFNLRADANQHYVLAFYRQPDDLAEDNQSNFLTRRWPRLLRTACLHFASEYRKDWEEAARYEATATMLLEQAASESDMALRGAIHDRTR